MSAADEIRKSKKLESVQQELEHLDVKDVPGFLRTVYSDTGNSAINNVHIFSGAVYAACHMNAWCFDSKTGKLFNAFSENEEELSALFVVSGCLDYMKEQLPYHYPVILSDSVGMVWIAEFSSETDDPMGPPIFVFGPVFYSAISPMVISENLSNLHFSSALTSSLEKVLTQIPVITHSAVEQYARMLHFMLTGEPCDSNSFLLQKAKVEVNLFDDSHEATYEDLRDDHASLERVLDIEYKLLKLVAEGRNDEVELENIRKNSWFTELVPGNSLRNVKDELIILNTKYMLVAEREGLPVRISRTLSLRYGRLIEKSKSLTELANLEHSMTADYIERIQEIKSGVEKSQEILIVEDYIRNMLNKPISIEDAAKLAGYTEYYLSRKFAKETGMKFADYVNKERVEYAKILLETSQMSVQCISDYLQFNSLSYFGRVFKKYSGMTPNEFRKNNKTEL